MSQISALELEHYRQTLLEAHVPAKLHSYYLRWLNLYRSFCRRQHMPEKGLDQLDAFIVFCRSRYADWQCQQAQNAVKLLADLQTESEAEIKAFDDSAEAILTQIAGRIKCRIQNTVEEIIAIGLDLILAKEMLPHGQFCQWLRQEFELSYATANRMMRAADAFCDKVITVRTLSKKALYTLAAPETSQVIRDQVLARLEAGEIITGPMIEELKQRETKLVKPTAAQGELKVLCLGLERWTERICQWAASVERQAVSAHEIDRLLQTIRTLEQELQELGKPQSLSAA